MQLLEDVFIVENLQILTEGKAGPMRVRGVFQRADEENNNKRIYGKPLLEREITKLAEAITERRLMGELDHPQHDSVKLSNVSHLITGLSMKGNEVIGEAEILDTPSGKVAKALIEGGVKVGISSRGMGTVSEDMDGKRHVNEDFRLITWDLVADPSTRGAYPGLTESTQIQEIIDRVYPEAQKVKNFTTLLKESLDEGKTKQSSKRKRTPKPEVGVQHDLPSRSSGRMSPKQFRKSMTAKADATLDAKYKDEPTKGESTSLSDLVRSKLYEAMDALDRATLAHDDLVKKVGKKRAGSGPNPYHYYPEQKPAAKKKKAAKRAKPKRPDAPGQKKLPGMENASTTLAGFMRTKLMETEEPTEYQKKVARRMKKNVKGKGVIKTRQRKEHKESGEPGETPRRTQIRIHGSGVPARMPRKRS